MYIVLMQCSYGLICYVHALAACVLVGHAKVPMYQDETCTCTYGVRVSGSTVVLPI